MPPGGAHAVTAASAAAGFLSQLSVSANPTRYSTFRERGLREADGFFLADAPCRHLRREEPDTIGVRKWVCDIYDRRPATCRDYCGKSLSGGKRYYVPEGCTMADEKSRSE